MGLEPPYLGDRRPQLDRFRSYVGEPDVPHNVLVTGLRGVGKTVLLNHYSTIAGEANWLVAEREFSEPDAEPATFARALLADLLKLTRQLSLSTPLKRTAGGLAEKVTDLLGDISVSYGDVEVSYSPGKARQAAPRRLDDDLRDALQQVGDLCRRSEHPGVVLRHDEFHVVQERKGEGAALEHVVRASGLANNLLHPILRSLIQKGLVYRPERGRVAFTAPMFGAFLRRRGE
jgi:hypothetical protein